MMTALAFIIGVLPLVVATGAGAGARLSIGTTVFGGMIAGACHRRSVRAGRYSWLFEELSAERTERLSQADRPRRLGRRLASDAGGIQQDDRGNVRRSLATPAQAQFRQEQSRRRGLVARAPMSVMPDGSSASGLGQGFQRDAQRLAHLAADQPTTCTASLAAAMRSARLCAAFSVRGPSRQGIAAPDSSLQALR